jgi:hypothetical protein
MTNTIYTEVRGTTAIIAGKRGTVTAIHHSSIDSSTDGAFVSWDQGGMAYVTTGQRTGDRGQHHEVQAVREIDRDEFDALSGIAALRTQLGWR